MANHIENMMFKRYSRGFYVPFLNLCYPVIFYAALKCNYKIADLLEDLLITLYNDGKLRDLEKELTTLYKGKPKTCDLTYLYVMMNRWGIAQSDFTMALMERLHNQFKGVAFFTKCQEQIQFDIIRTNSFRQELIDGFNPLRFSAFRHVAQPLVTTLQSEHFLASEDLKMEIGIVINKYYIRYRSLQASLTSRELIQIKRIWIGEKWALLKNCLTKCTYNGG